MKTTRSTLIKSIAATFAALMLTACGSDSGGGGGGGSTGTSSISLTDAPIDEALDVTVRFDGVEFQPADGDRFMLYLADTTGTCEVVDVQDSANPCEVNLLDYQGVDRITIVDRATMPAGQYSWLRLILNNEPGSITLINGNNYDLRVPSGAQTGLKLNGGFIVAVGNHTDYTIDFDLRKSVHDPVGLPEYILRPTLRMMDNSQVGSLSGIVDTSFFEGGDCTGAVYIFDGDTIDAPDDEDGDGGGPDPITTVMVPDDGTHEYMVGFLTEGDYITAFTCDALADDPTVDDIAEDFSFLSEATVTIVAGENTVQNFLPAP
ncbi:MAG: DUF4382 domain-containing protein [Gammaproteobacteria bacterium]|nr:DUF4382 domain-containing protein [Gammaproteobacteria bacterium]MDH3985386.1 DUF4382 domain-containing protein [Gammaproteobacteria bacterium]